MTDETNPNSSDVAAALAAGRQMGAIDVKQVGGIPVITLPKDMELHQLPHLRETPRDLDTKIAVDNADSFIAYFNAFGDPNVSVVFCNIEMAMFRGVIDYHVSQDRPAWCRHHVVFTCRQTKEWKAWVENDGEKMDQLTFACFIEQNFDEIVQPEAAQMLEIATSLKAKTTVDFKSGKRLNDGQVQFQYNEVIEGRAGHAGDITIPETLKLGIRVFEGTEPYELTARFRYRLDKGNLVMWYDLVRPHKVHESAVKDVLEQIRAQAKPRLFLHGDP